MTCLELQEILPEIIDSVRSPEQEAHLQSCSECAGLVTDLHSISQQAKLLREYAEPSPRVWNSIEITLRQEGLIRQPQRDRSLAAAATQTFAERWRLAWMLPVAAALLVAVGVMLYRTPNQSGVARGGTSAPATTSTVASAVITNDDRDFLATVESSDPGMRTSYETDLQNINAYISDAEQSVNQDPTDDEAKQSLVDAYDQKAALYELAMDRSVQ